MVRGWSWSRAGLRETAAEAAELAADARSQQVLADDGSPAGDQEAAAYRTQAEQEEARAVKASREAERRFLRRPVGPAPYLRESYRRDPGQHR